MSSRRAPVTGKAARYDVSMTNHWLHSLARLTDEALLTRVHDLARCERRTTVNLIAHLAEMDERRLHLAEGCSSLFTYCTEVLHFSEHAAYNRIECARAARRFPMVFERLADGSVHLTAVRLLSPHLTEDNHVELIDRARHLGKRGVEAIVAALRPLPDLPSVVRRLPTVGATVVASPGAGPAGREDHHAPLLAGPVPAAASRAASRAATVVPLAPERYRVQITADEEMHEDLKAATEMLRHQVPNGDPAIVLKMALKLLVKELKRRKFAETARPRPRVEESDRHHISGGKHGRTTCEIADRNSRHIPAAVRREVVRRDEYQCAFQAGNGRRCAARGQLEFHHLVPYALGGRAVVENISLRCRAHNAHEAGSVFIREPATPYDFMTSPTRSGTSWMT